MRPKAIAISIVALLLIGASSHLIALRVSAQYAAPVMTEGDFWEYKTMHSYQDLDTEGIERYTMTGYKDITVVDTEYHVLILSWDAEGSYEGTSRGFYMKGNWSGNGKGYYETDDFQMVKAERNTEMTGMWRDGATGSMTETISQITYYDVISDTWDYPVDVGSSGEQKRKVSVSVVMQVDMGSGIPSQYSDDYHYYENLTISCKKIETISVPAGTFETYHILLEEEDGGYYQAWGTPEIGGQVKIEHYDKNDTKVSSDELTAYSYAAVKGDILIENLMYIILTTVVALIVVAVGLMILNRRKRRAVKVLMKKPTEPPSVGIPEQQQEPPTKGVT